jgi:hypothetical protein
VNLNPNTNAMPIELDNQPNEGESGGTSLRRKLGSELILVKTLENERRLDLRIGSYMVLSEPQHQRNAM